MLREYTLLPATAAAGLIAGPATATFLAAAPAAAAAGWLAKRPLPADLCFANLDPHTPDAAMIPDALRRALDRARQTGRAVRLRLSAPLPGASAPSRLSINAKGDAEIGGRPRAVALQRPGVWLADHPLPLHLAPARSLTLVFEPCGPERVRVSLPPVAAGRPARWALLALLAAAACALDAGWLLAAALGFAFQSCLLQQQGERAADDPEILGR